MIKSAGEGKTAGSDRERKVTATACTRQPSLGDKGTPSPGPSKATTKPAGLTHVAVRVGEGKTKDPRWSKGTRSCADTGGQVDGGVGPAWRSGAGLHFSLHSSQRKQLTSNHQKESMLLNSCPVTSKQLFWGKGL